MDPGLVERYYAFCDLLRYFPTNINPDSAVISVVVAPGGSPQLLTRDGVVAQWNRDRLVFKGHGKQQKRKGRKGKRDSSSSSRRHRRHIAAAAAVAAAAVVVGSSS
jgi:hypothetical protein